MADGGVLVAPVVGVPGLLRAWRVPLVAEVPPVSELHLSIHSDGDVHIRDNETKTDWDSFQVPPLQNFAAASYFLHVFPGPMEYYPAEPNARGEDTVLDIADVQDQGFHVLLAFAVTTDAPSKAAAPGLDPTGPKKMVRLVRATAGSLHIQAAVVWLADSELPPPERETWKLVSLPEGGDFLPRPAGGTVPPWLWQSET